MHRALLGALVLLAACQPGPETAQGTAQRFVDEHYVRMDLEAAKAFCVGLAAHKVEQEMELVKGQVIDDTTRMPRVHYKLLEEKTAGENDASFVFEGSIRVEDAGTFTRKWLVSTRRDGAAWKVSNYQEFDEPGPGEP